MKAVARSDRELATTVADRAPARAVHDDRRAPRETGSVPPAAASPSTAAALVWRERPAHGLATDPALADAWDRLNATRGDLVCLSACAVAAALATLGNGGERLLLGHDGSRLVAAFVLVPGGRLQWQTFQPSQLPLGAWVLDARLRLEDLADSLLRCAALRALTLSITRIDPLIAPREPDRADNRHADYIETAWLDVDGTLEAYWAARGKNLRQNMRKQRNKLAAERIVAQTRRLTDLAEMAAAVERYGQLESGGWKSTAGSAVHADNPQGRFYRALLEAAARRGEAVVYEHLFDGRTVASNLCLRRGSTLVILKTTYDESIRTYSPAFLLHQDIVEELFGTRGGITRVEYFGQLMEWHTRWTANKRTLHHLTLYRWPMLKKLADSRRAAPDATAAETARAGAVTDPAAAQPH